MSGEGKPSRGLRHPRHWPTWAGLAVFRALGLLPWGVQRALAAVLGALIHRVAPVRRRVVLTNLRLAFPGWSERGRRRLARAHYHALALGLFETCAGWWARSERLPRHTVSGLEHLERARAGGRGVILLSAHFTTLEIGGRLLRERTPFGCLYRDPNNPALAEVMRANRERRLEVAVHFDDLRGLIRALRAGHVIWYAPDQGRRTKLAEIVPFFGEPAVTSTATSRLAQMSGAPVVPFFPRRLPDGSYELTILPALENFPGPDPAADALRLNQLFEEHIRRAPEQYFWVHKRYKRRGPAYPDAYTGRPAARPAGEG